MHRFLIERFTSGFLYREVAVFDHWRIAVPSLFVFCLAAMVNAIEVAGGAFMVYPDSATYVSPAYIFFHEGSLRGVSLFRVPGYPIFLTPLFGLFGENAMLAMAIAQHVMTTMISVFVVKIGDELDRTRWLGLIAGVFSAFALQLHAYARLPMTEVPFTFLVVPGLLYTLRYLRTAQARPFFAAIVLFSVAAMIRPSGVYLPLALMAIPVVGILSPSWRLFAEETVPVGRRNNLLRLVAAGAIYACVVTPWMFRNLAVHDYFGLSPTLGVNLYGTVIDAGRIIDANSPAIIDIKKRWNEYEASRVARGESPETRYDWRQHVISLGYYRAATGKTQMAADKVFLRASLDSIRAHPGAYARLVLRDIYYSFIYTAGAFYYAPGVEAGARPSWYMPYAQSVIQNEESRQTIFAIASHYVPKDQNPFVWRSPTNFTPAYGVLMSTYNFIQSRGVYLLAIFVFGLGVAIFLMVKQLNIQWLAVFFYLFYVAALPFLIVPGSPRHRLPADPLIDVVTALAVIHAVLLVHGVWEHILKTWRQRRA